MSRVAPPVSGPILKRPKAPGVTHVRKDRSFLSWVHDLPCVVSGTSPVEAAHIRYGAAHYGKAATGMAEKADDRWVVPLSAHEHRTGPDAQHMNNERDYWRRRGIDPCLVAALIYSAFQADDLQSAIRVCCAARAGLIKGEFA
jgi:hypothetical protein